MGGGSQAVARQAWARMVPGGMCQHLCWHFFSSDGTPGQGQQHGVNAHLTFIVRSAILLQHKWIGQPSSLCERVFARTHERTKVMSKKKGPRPQVAFTGEITEFREFREFDM